MSQIPTTQVKVTLPQELYFYLKSKADKFGLSMSAYLRNLALEEVKDMDLPVFKMSKKTEQHGLKALKEHREGKTAKIDDIDEYFDNL